LTGDSYWSQGSTLALATTGGFIGGRHAAERALRP